MLIAVNRREPEMMFRKWGPVRTGQTRTRVEIEPVLQQSVVASKRHGQSAVSASHNPIQRVVPSCCLRGTVGLDLSMYIVDWVRV